MLRVYVALCILTILSGCDSQNNGGDDLREFVEQIKARPSSRIPPLPVINKQRDFPLVIIDNNLFTAINRRANDGSVTSTCYSPTERKIPHLLIEKSLSELTFLRYFKSRWTFNVTIWDGESMAVYQKGNLIAQQSWQLLSVDNNRVTLGKLDKCSQVVETKVVTLKTD